MLKTLRWPLLALLFSIILLTIALVLRESDEPQGPDTPPIVSNPTATTTPLPTPAVILTPVPTVGVVDDSLAPIAGELTEGLVGNIRKLNPLFASFNPVDRDITSLIFEGLTTINTYGEVVPDLAERWDVSRDGLEYIFSLRRDILWQDGLPFTSDDVRYTVDVMRDPDFPGDATLTAFWRTVEMTVIDDYTLRFRLVQPLASFPDYLRFGILPAHALDGYPVAELDRHPFNLSPIGTGPYQRENLYVDDGQFAISLRVAPTYRQRPEGQTGYTIDRIVFRTYATVEQAVAALARGEINSIGQLPTERLDSIDSLNHLAVHLSVIPSVGVLIYNWQRDDVNYFQNQRVHLALARGVDRQGAVERTLGAWAIPAESPLIPGSWAYDATALYPPYDLDAARTTLASVSFEEAAPPTETTPTGDGPTPVPTEAVEEPTPEATTDSVRRNFTILVVNQGLLEALAEDLAQQLSSLGFMVTVEAVDADTYRQRLQDGDFDTAMVEYSYAPYADPDPYTFWHVSQYQEGANYGGLRDLRISEVVERARREAVGVNRVALYREFQELFTERVPALTLYHPVYAYVTDDRLDGVQMGFISTPSDRFQTIQDWQWSLN